jgi:Ca2+-binding RTX toxin-like protein
MTRLSTPQLGFADIVIDYFNSGNGPIDDSPYGGTFNEVTFRGSYPVPVDLGVVLGEEPFDDGTVDFLSLPEGSFVTVAFLDEVIVDGMGDDIFITEIAGNGEIADVFVRAGKGGFTLLGQARGGETASFDLADIGFSGFVTEVRIVGLNDAGGSPGYDVVNVRALSAGLVDLDENNRLTGSDKGDIVDLGAGRDVFRGGKGNDVASGGGGRDKIFGQKGDDVLNGGRGNDRLSGGAGEDAFEFARRDGKDTILDFDASEDIVRILSGAQAFKGLDIEQLGDDAVVSFARTVITFLDTDAGDLGRGVFDFA